MEFEDAVIYADGVARVVAAGKADHEIGHLCQEIYDLSFRLIAPLGAYNDADRHGLIPCREYT